MARYCALMRVSPVRVVPGQEHVLDHSEHTRLLRSTRATKTHMTTRYMHLKGLAVLGTRMDTAGFHG